MLSQPPEPQDELSQVRRTNERLTRELEALQQKLEARENADKAAEERNWWVLSNAAHFAKRVALGPTLVDATEKWLEKVLVENQLPARETAEVAAAMFARLVRVGTVGLLLALLPSAIAIVQTLLMKEQNRLFLLQTTQIQDQLNAAAEQNKTAAEALALSREQDSRQRETELTRLVFNDDVPWPQKVPAIREYLALQRGRSGPSRVSLPSLNLSGAIVSGLDLSNTDIDNANFRGAVFVGGSFKSAHVTGDISGASFHGVHFGHSIFRVFAGSTKFKNTRHAHAQLYIDGDTSEGGKDVPVWKSVGGSHYFERREELVIFTSSVLDDLWMELRRASRSVLIEKSDAKNAYFKADLSLLRLEGVVLCHARLSHRGKADWLSRPTTRVELVNFDAKTRLDDFRTFLSDEATRRVLIAWGAKSVPEDECGSAVPSYEMKLLPPL